jgi:hypothetical protein
MVNPDQSTYWFIYFYKMSPFNLLFVFKELEDYPLKQ